jgi:hypothetical protein
MVRFGTEARVGSALLALFTGALGGLYSWTLYVHPVDRGWGTFAAVGVLAAGALLFLRIAIVGNPGRVLSRRMTLTGVAKDAPGSSEGPVHR